MSKSNFPSVDKALASDGETTPMQMLTAAYEDAPDGIKSHLDGCALDVLMTELPKLQLLFKHGPTIPVSKLVPIREIFDESIAMVEQVAPSMAKQVSVTTRDSAGNIADEIDRAFRRSLLTDTDANHAAYIDAMAAHARLVKCIETIALTEEQKTIIAGKEAENAVSH